jgi:glycerol-3-phosphate acyltransferase PlsY
MEYLTASILGYLLGSIPTAYLLLKKIKGIDITATGSGNVGAMNSYEITNSKITGIIVLVIDALKGFLSVFIVTILFPNNFGYPALALIFAILSHCFNPWLDFKGGRGLATAAGGAIFIFPFMLVAWLVLWTIIYVLKKDILVANIFATILSLMVSFATSNIAVRFCNPSPESLSELMIFTTAVLVLIFIKHIEPLKDILKEKK